MRTTGRAFQATTTVPATGPSVRSLAADAAWSPDDLRPSSQITAAHLTHKQVSIGTARSPAVIEEDFRGRGAGVRFLADVNHVHMCSPGGGCPVLASHHAGPRFTFPATGYHRRLTGTKLYLSVTEARACVCVCV